MESCRLFRGAALPAYETEFIKPRLAASRVSQMTTLRKRSFGAGLFSHSRLRPWRPSRSLWEEFTSTAPLRLPLPRVSRTSRIADRAGRNLEVVMIDAQRLQRSRQTADRIAQLKRLRGGSGCATSARAASECWPVCGCQLGENSQRLFRRCANGRQQLGWAHSTSCITRPPSRNSGTGASLSLVSRQVERRWLHDHTSVSADGMPEVRRRR